MKRHNTPGLFTANIVRDYPLSPLVPQAKEKLTKLGIPIPQADPTALARMQQEQQMPHPRSGLLHRFEGPLEGKPDMSAAARVGEPQMSPPDEASEMETLFGRRISVFQAAWPADGRFSGSVGQFRGDRGRIGNIKLDWRKREQHEYASERRSSATGHARRATDTRAGGQQFTRASGSSASCAAERCR